MQSRLTVRLEMFEVYEGRKDGSKVLLFVTSDPSEAKENCTIDDQIVRRWWVREGASGHE